MKYREECNQEKQSIRTVEEWIRFRNKWYDSKGWPKKSSEQITNETEFKRRLTSGKLGGRSWAYSYLMHDLTPEAIYELFYTSYHVGFKLTNPELYYSKKEAGPEVYWEQDCPFCGISTREIGDEDCPVCARSMIYVILEVER